jgi:hypothetical protein
MIKKIVVDFLNHEFSVHLWSNRPDLESYLQSTLEELFWTYFWYIFPIILKENHVKKITRSIFDLYDCIMQQIIIYSR